MALTVVRTTYSGVLKDNMDFSTGFADAEGRLVAQGLTLPGHLGSVPTAMASIMHHYRDEIREGDVFIMNDPSMAACTCRISSSSSRCSTRASAPPVCEPRQKTARFLTWIKCGRGRHLTTRVSGVGSNRVCEGCWNTTGIVGIPGYRRDTVPPGPRP